MWTSWKTSGMSESLCSQMWTPTQEGVYTEKMWYTFHVIIWWIWERTFQQVMPWNCVWELIRLIIHDHMITWNINPHEQMDGYTGRLYLCPWTILVKVNITHTVKEIFKHLIHPFSNVLFKREWQFTLWISVCMALHIPVIQGQMHQDVTS